MSDTRKIRALASFVAFDGKQQNVFNPEKTLANGETRKATEGELPADLARQYVDAGQAEYVAEKPAKAPKVGENKGGKPAKAPKVGADDGEDGGADGAVAAADTDAPAA